MSVENDKQEAAQQAPETDEDGIEIQVVDDTPPEDRGRPRRPEGKEPDLPGDDEVSKHSADVQKRIKQLKYEFHEERRSKEEAARERDEAIKVAQRFHQESERLRGELARGESVLIEQAKGRVEAVLGQARRAYKEAYESGDSDALLKAQEDLAQAQIERDKIHGYRPQHTNGTVPQRQEPQAQPQPQQPPRQIDEKAKAWADANPWFSRDRVMTAYVMGLHEELVIEKKMDPRSDEYYRAINESVREKFPERFDEIRQGDRQERPRQNGNVVAPAQRSAKGPRKVVLTESQVRVAKRLGLTTEQYARQLLQEQQANG